MSKQQNNIKAFFESNDNELNIEHEINLYNDVTIEHDYNNTDLMSNFSLTLDLTAIS